MRKSDELARVRTNQRQTSAGGVACPTCGVQIPVAIEQLLAMQDLICPSPTCRTTLKLNAAGSGDALAVLAEAKTRLDGR